MREDWIEALFGDIIIESRNGFTGRPNEKNIGNPRIGITSITQSKSISVDVEDHKFIEIPLEKIERYNVLKEDVLVCRQNGNHHFVGLFGVVKKEIEGLIFSDSLIRFRLISGILSSDFIVYFMNSGARRNIESMCSTTAGNFSINSNSIKSLNIPIAPLPEQRAIVAKIEELFSDLDKGIADLKKAQDQLVIFRQAVLKKAFEGELTKEWREKQTNLPTADELLEQIKEERQKHYAQQIEDWKEAVIDWEKNGKEGKKPGKPKAKIALPDLTDKEKGDLPKLSHSWSWIKLDQIGELFCGQSPSVSEVNLEGKGMLYVTGPEQWNGREIEQIKWTEFPRRIVPDGTIFITVKGAGVGKMFPGIHCAIGRDVYAFKPDTKVNFEYVFHALKHSIEVVIMKALGDIPGLSKNHILDHYLGFCSAEEQHQIVKEIESRLSVCDKVEQSITESLEKAKALRQSILKKAFEGSLLSAIEIAKCKTAKDYEPASVLLKKIRAEKKKK